MTKNEAIQLAAMLREDNERMQSVLRIIRTWASFDVDNEDRLALVPSKIVKLCDRTLGDCG